MALLNPQVLTRLFRGWPIHGSLVETTKSVSQDGFRTFYRHSGSTLICTNTANTHTNKQSGHEVWGKTKWWSGDTPSCPRWSNYMVCPRLGPISASWVSFPCVELARIGAGTISYSPQDICISYFVLLSERVANERRGARKM